ncbi:gluconokinase [Actinosynnema pretiosum]|uniref:Carbohydrate kinase n=1 Tax=Actinosynnema pretiosum TaxID=42197 RepID=A0A290YZ33_9PSEU|nr:gluconokinase [Actinosynnema pretiosum]ATE52041.1 carbohydrate kinase [Actinosynnema pretiosum]
MRDKGVVLAVDLGTTATKVVAVDPRARVLRSTERGYPMRTTPSGEATQDPDEVLAAALAAVSEVALACPEGVRALVLTGALHTLLGLDESGRPVTPSLSWADRRAVEQVARLRAADGVALHRATGTPVHTMSPLVKLRWFADHGVRAHRWCGLKDYVFAHLTGVLATEHSSGSATGLMDLRALDWRPEALEHARVRAEQLPELHAPTASFPLRAVVDGVAPGTPVVLGGGDGPLANLGVGAIVPGVAALSLGTSGALRVVSPEPAVDERGRVFCYAIGDGLWTVGGAVSNGGVVASWAAESFGADVVELLDEAARVPVGASGVTALPYLLGERAPWWDADATSAVVGLRREHGRAELTRALVEGVAQQLALVLDAVRSVAEVRLVRATGGALRHELWASVLCAALDVPLEITEDTGGSAVGAALLAWRSLGELDSLAGTADLVVPERRYEPDPDAAAHYAAARPGVERLYEALRGL